MQQYLGAVTFLVKEYDEAIDYFVGKLRFKLTEDEDMGNDKRWVKILPTGSAQCQLLLARAVNPAQEACIGNQSGDRVFLFLHSDDFWRDYHFMKAQGVTFLEEPREESYATVVVFRDLYGNKWDLLQPKI